jgi:hypothetical protein
MENRLPSDWCVDMRILNSSEVKKILNFLDRIGKPARRFLEVNLRYPYYGQENMIPCNSCTIATFKFKLLSFKEFIEMTEEEFNPKEGDLVEVSNGLGWYKRIFLMKTEYNHIISAEGKTAQNDYRGIGSWNYMRPIPKPEIFELTIEEIAKLKGCKPEQIRIKE